MARYKATPDGNVPFTPEEEAEWDVQQAEYLAGADDRAAAKVREERDAKLSATDWTASTDVTMTAEMTTYRQALRDVPSQAGFPNTINWPDKP
mgnify:CR=1 FL=1|jgi:hypothetical protein|tara:strand:+ start:2422 stop:2700 length:279 start_codon:yes stop_codon:yes gene_type:complete